jgi:ferrous iron transport protein A
MANQRLKELLMNLKQAEEGVEYSIKSINTDDEELNSFLFSLGCYSGETITVIRRLKGGCIVAIKDGRYNIDNQLAEVIFVK